MKLLCIAPVALEEVVAAEVRAAGGEQVRTARAAVAFEGGLSVAYRVLMWSRVAQRVLVEVAAAPCDGRAALYEAARATPWGEHLSPDASLAVRFTGRSDEIRRTTFGGQVIKDGVCDRLREDTGRRPDVDRENPDVVLHGRLEGGRVTLSVDLAGESLHKRGYRPHGAQAPLKENLAAGVLAIAGWPEAAAAGLPLVDPMCGSGTLAVEAALQAAGTAPGLLRERWGFESWRGHDPAAWRAVVEEARAADRRGAPGAVAPVFAWDADGEAVALARRSARAAGVAALVTVAQRGIGEAAPPGGRPPGLVVVNPPYGERLGALGGGQRRALEVLYGRLGDVLKRRFGGWSACVMAADPGLARLIGLKPARRTVVYNGALECRLLSFPLTAPARVAAEGATSEAAPASPFGQRLEKRARHLSRWARREGVTCYRVYDRDLPAYAVAVDLYEGRAHVAEYSPPAGVDAAKARSRLREVLEALPAALGVAETDVSLKVRARQRGAAQYGPLGEGGERLEVGEGGRRFLVNLTDRVDTGLFLDHRRTRAWVADLAAGKRFLNLFCYTAAATVYAATGGARSTTSVDLSSAYLDWARRNLELNGVRTGGEGARHALVRADCLRWLGDAGRARARWDVVLLDPPTFSNSKAMAGSLDVARDHVGLLADTAAVLADGGVIVFATHARGFRLDEAALRDAGLVAEDVTRRTLPEDFRRRARPFHRTWLVRRGAGGGVTSGG